MLTLIDTGVIRTAMSLKLKEFLKIEIIGVTYSSCVKYTKDATHRIFLYKI
jgi:hypothetical protein